MHALPFKMQTDHEISHFRAETFWTKEPETLKWLQLFLNSDSCRRPLYVDVGANIGIYSLYAMTLNPQVRVIAIEPFVANFGELQKNVFLNNFQDRLVCLNVAASDSNRVGELQINDFRVGSTGAQIREECNDGVRTEVLRVDSIIEQVFTGLKFDTLIVKIDTDGHELAVLDGLTDLLMSGAISSVLCELDNHSIDLARHFMTSFGMREDTFFESTEGHSTFRRVQGGNLERNVIFTKRMLIEERSLI